MGEQPEVLDPEIPWVVECHYALGDYESRFRHFRRGNYIRLPQEGTFELIGQHVTEEGLELCLRDVLTDDRWDIRSLPIEDALREQRLRFLTEMEVLAWAARSS